jgi:hypothetical protein
MASREACGLKNRPDLCPALHEEGRRRTGRLPRDYWCDGTEQSQKRRQDAGATMDIAAATRGDAVCELRGGNHGAVEFRDELRETLQDYRPVIRASCSG